MISALVNGEARRLEPGTTVAALVAAMGGQGRGVAVAIDGEVVARSAWEQTVLAEGDRVEVLRAAQGGC